MKIIPAIDIKEGKCVQLVGGDPSRKIFKGDPLEAAKKWNTQGADLIHVVNLDGAIEGKNRNKKIIKRIIELSKKVQIGGGIRTEKDAKEIIGMGAEKIIIGTKALDKKFMEKVSQEIGKNRIIASIDSLEQEVVVKGWKEKTGIGLEELAKNLEPYVWGFLYTDVEREGKLEGINLERIKKVLETIERPVIASGGISSLEDIEKLGKTGVWGAIIGSALYKKKFTLEEAIKTAQG